MLKNLIGGKTMNKPLTVWQKYNRVWGQRMIKKAPCEYYWENGRVKEINTKLVKNTHCYIDTSDYPDLCDSHIEEAFWIDDTPLSEDDIELLNENSSFVYECCMDQLH
tara:strand:- start:167 stop:490 length:324 start_codon:yes stop_codon:yes gene_type:complete